MRSRAQNALIRIPRYVCSSNIRCINHVLDTKDVSPGILLPDCYSIGSYVSSNIEVVSCPTVLDSPRRRMY